MGIHEQFGLRRIINASGRMTALGGSPISAAVADAMAQAGREHLEMDELQRAAEKRIATSLGADDAVVTTGAAAGVALMTAACIAGEDLTRIEQLPDPGDAPHEILIQVGHLVNFGAPLGQMIRLGGGQVRTIGATNKVDERHLTGAIGPNTAAFLYVQSHHAVQKGMLPLDRCIGICREAGLPVLVDAAAEEDLAAMVHSGADLITFSGSKAIAGPASGIVAGRGDLVAACRAQHAGIGRSMKVGKETIVGLAVALEAYMRRDAAAERDRRRAVVERLLAGFALVPGIVARRRTDEAGREIERAVLTTDPATARALVRFLQASDPAIFPRLHLIEQGVVAFDPRPITLDEAEIIVERVRAFFTTRSDSTLHIT